MAQIFALMLDEEDEDIHTQIWQRYGPDNFIKLSSLAYLVYTTESASDVVNRLGIGSSGTNSDTGAVAFSLNGQYSGFFDKKLWRWVDRKREEARAR